MPDTSPHFDSRPVRWTGYAALIVVTLFFSGAFSECTGLLSCLDFTVLNGSFGKIAENFTFMGKGGSGARHGFLFALSLVPGIMLALGVVEVAERLDALRAAQRLLTPLMRPLMGLPGIAGLALISSMQSSDAGAAMTRELSEKKLITEAEKTIFAAFQFSSGSSITVYLSMGIALFPYLSVSHLVPLGVILFYKVVGMNIMRLYLHLVTKKEAA
ncbi:nucleoside recognition domain-containing protein [Mailhella sp.]|uniref:nucleoside recognition domain-containing protein n=1 Tax=Mailhella sp. TaxID=1981029 RepID=UPI0040627EC6